MNRIVFDASRKLGKDVEFEMIGEHTEVDKNIIEHISDPLMHLVRNSVDHGVETNEERVKAGKKEKGKVPRELMLSGAPLATRLPGRTGWELRLVVQGGPCASSTRSRRWTSRCCSGGRRSAPPMRPRCCGAPWSCERHGTHCVH